MTQVRRFTTPPKTSIRTWQRVSLLSRSMRNYQSAVSWERAPNQEAESARRNRLHPSSLKSHRKKITALATSQASHCAQASEVALSEALSTRVPWERTRTWAQASTSVSSETSHLHHPPRAPLQGTNGTSQLSHLLLKLSQRRNTSLRNLKQFEKSIDQRRVKIASVREGVLKLSIKKSRHRKHHRRSRWRWGIQSRLRVHRLWLRKASVHWPNLRVHSAAGVHATRWPRETWSKKLLKICASLSFRKHELTRMTSRRARRQQSETLM